MYEMSVFVRVHLCEWLEWVFVIKNELMKNRLFFFSQPNSEEFHKIVVFCFSFLEPVSKCWRCVSNAKGSEFCNDPFDESKVTESQRLAYFVDCVPPPNRPNTPNNTQSNQHVVCRKLKKIGMYFHSFLIECMCKNKQIFYLSQKNAHLKILLTDFLLPFQKMTPLLSIDIVFGKK